jgi:formylglycine-generating enzyme required for sulfatase activity
VTLADARPFAFLGLLSAACGIGHAAQQAPSEREQTADAPSARPASSVAPACPFEMAQVKAFCVDRYEAYVVEVDPQGSEKPHSPYEPVTGLNVRAKAAAGVVPQAYISQVEAQAACANAGKRLCTEAEFTLACRGPDESAKYPYGGAARRPGVCNEGKGSSMPRFFGRNSLAWTLANFNDPRLNQWPGGLAKTGEHAECVSPYGVYDAVGNLHEWGADPPDERKRGRFRGGFYGDAEVNGPGCSYVTRAHGVRYHDYSTGFRCCADATTLRAP